MGQSTRSGENNSSGNLSFATSPGAISFSEKMKGFASIAIRYLGIVFTIVVGVYALHNLLPQLFKIISKFIIKILTSDFS